MLSAAEVVTHILAAQLETCDCIDLLCCCVWSIHILEPINHLCSVKNHLEWPSVWTNTDHFYCFLFLFFNITTSSVVLLILSLRWLSLHHVMKFSISPLYSSVKIVSKWKQHVSHWNWFILIVHINIEIAQKTLLIGKLNSFKVVTMERDVRRPTSSR